MLTYLKSLLSLSPGVKLFLLSEMAFGLGVGMYAVLFNFHLLGMGFNTEQIGIATACHTISVALLAYPAGIFTDRFGGKNAMVLGTVLVSLGYLLLAMVETETTLYLVQALVGAGFAFVIACEFPYIMSLCERKEDETTSFNLLVAAFTLAMAVGNILGAQLPEVLPVGETIYQTTLYLVAVSMFLVFLLRLFLPAKSERVRAEEAQQPHKGKTKIIPSRAVMIYVLYAALLGLTIQLVAPFENVIMRERFAFSDATVGYLMAATSFLTFLASLFTPYLMQTRHHKLALYLGFLVYAAILFVMGFEIAGLFYGGLLLMKGIANTTVFAMIDSRMMKATALEERGLHAGLRHMFRAGAGSLATWYAGTLLHDGDYYTTYWLAFGGIAIVFLFYMVIVRKQLQQDLGE